MDGTVRLPTRDGGELAADVSMPDGGWAVAVLCHPHPDRGGDRGNVVVDALFHALPAAGVAALRFDFRRPVGTGPAGLATAVTDVHAALDAAAGLAVRARTAARGVAGARTRSLVLIGYSFGASMALRAVAERDDVDAVVAVAPPLTMLPVPSPPTLPTLVLVPTHDQFGPPADVAPVVATWPAAELEVVGSADHFLAGHTAAVADRIASWLVATCRRPPS